MDCVYNVTRFKTPRLVVIHDSCIMSLFIGLRFLVVLYVVIIQVCDTAGDVETRAKPPPHPIASVHAKPRPRGIRGTQRVCKSMA